MSVRERTLYNYICRVFTKYGWKCYEQVGVEGKEPDLVIEREDVGIASEVKIDTEIKLNEAIVDAFGKACLLKLPHSMALLFPKYVREMPLSELEKAYPNLDVTAIILTQWLSDRRALTLDDLANLLTSSYQSWLKTKTVEVNYNLVVESTRDNIRDLATYLRFHMYKKPILNTALAVIGRFDMFRSQIEDFSGALEKEAKLYIADIAAYILANQLLFYHILSEKLDYEKLPEINPIAPPADLLRTLDELFETGRKTYPHIFSLDLFPLLIETRDNRVLNVVARLIANFKAIHPQHIREDLFGRLYQETIPPETRKNLGAFYTKPEAARLLATLAIDKFDSKVLDPACGSGTLLVESYHRKLKLAPPLHREELHKQFVNDIYGIDIMHFATHMTTTNLTAQNISMPVKPNVYSRDGVASMIQCLQTDEDPPSVTPITRWIDMMAGTGIPYGFDVVIMNPPFTRRKRIPSDIRSSLEKLVPEVTGVTGYWAYFFMASDRVLKQNGILAAVTPEEFFVGGAAETVRSYLTGEGYLPQYIVRSATEIAFSEGAHYRDYLAVFKKSVRAPLVVALLKRKLQDIHDKTEEIGEKMKDFAKSPHDTFSSGDVEMFKVHDVPELMKRHINNLKPFVGFNTVKAQRIALELLNKLENEPTIDELQKQNVVRVRLYRPGQYKEKDVEIYAEKLFASRYGARSPNVTFLVDKTKPKTISLRSKKHDVRLNVPLKSLIPSLRTYSAVSHMNVTDEEEYAIIDPDVLPIHVSRFSGLVPRDKVRRACRDIKAAYDSLSGNILLARRIRLTSPQAYWLAFYSDNLMLGSQLPSIKCGESAYSKVLAIYLNSIITLLQLISFTAETEGAWVSLDHERVWSNIHVPKPTIDRKLATAAMKLFDQISKSDVKSLQVRVRERHKVQRAIDKLALQLVGLEELSNRLDELYDAVTAELEAMHRIMEASTRIKRKNRRLEEEEQEKIEPLERWLT